MPNGFCKTRNELSFSDCAQSLSYNASKDGIEIKRCKALSTDKIECAKQGWRKRLKYGKAKHALKLINLNNIKNRIQKPNGKNRRYRVVDKPDLYNARFNLASPDSTQPVLLRYNVNDLLIHAKPISGASKLKTDPPTNVIA